MLICYLLLYLGSFSGILSSAVVTLDSMKIYKTHEWLKITKPVIYFACKGENKTVLPDVKQANITYSFNGKESWQPLTQLTSIKCKRYGFYEHDTLKPDDMYDEWEFCPSDFRNSNGLSLRKKRNVFDATFLCPQCVTHNTAAKSGFKVKGMRVAVVILICLQVSTVLGLVILSVHKYCQNKKREQNQARFVKLFDDEDDIADELDVVI